MKAVKCEQCGGSGTYDFELLKDGTFEPITQTCEACKGRGIIYTK